MFSSEPLIHMCTKTLPLESLCVFVYAEKAEGVCLQGIKGYETRTRHPSAKSSGKIPLFAGARRLLSNHPFIIVSLIIMVPEDFPSCVFP